MNKRSRWTTLVKPAFSAAVAFAMIAGAFIGRAEGQVATNWTASDGNWGETVNWDNGVPVGFFDAIIGPGAGTISHDVEYNSISGLQLDGAAADILLNQTLEVQDTLQWSQGQISGPMSLDFSGVGELVNVDLETTFNNFGQMNIGSDGLFVRLESHTGNGQWNNKSGSLMEFPQSSAVGTFDGGPQGVINNETGAEMLFVDTATYIVWETNNEGLIEVGNGTGVFSGALFVGDFHQSAEGVIKLNEGFVDFFSQVVMFGKVTGNGGVLNLSSTFDGELEPGGPQIGTIDVAGALKMTKQTTTSMQIGPNFTADLVTNIGGPLQLAGTLNIEALPGATTGVYTLFTYNNGSGLQVENISLGITPPGFEGFLFLDTASQSIKLNVTDMEPISPAWQRKTDF